jgi:hypothetical protein
MSLDIIGGERGKIALRRNVTVSHAGRTISVGWISFQPDGSISFGLKDRAYVSPRLRERRFIWNVYNRITIEYVLPSNPRALLQVKNPHFTFHPDVMFHLKSNADRKAKDEAIFEGIADVGIVLQQQGEMPWIRATSAPLRTLQPSTEARNDGIETSDLGTTAAAVMLDCSTRVEIDFIRPEDVVGHRDNSSWEFVWGKVGLRIRVGHTAPQIATLAWFHSA